MKYDTIFNEYDTADGVPFYFLGRSITFPQDKNLEIYDYIFVDDDIAWTIVSYKIYGTIDYWWVLSALNPKMKFFAFKGELIRYIKPDMLTTVLNYI